MTAKISALFFLFLTGSTICMATSYSARNDFSITNGNPNGVWSYGSSATSGGAVSLLTTTANNGGWQAEWTDPGGFPADYINYSGSDVISGTVDAPTNVVQMHPASDGTNAVVEFIAPSTGLYSIGGQFQGDDTAGTTTNVGIFLNGTTLFTGEVTGYYPSGGSSVVPFSLSQMLTAGDKVDFSVGVGTDGNYLFDSTGLIANVSTSSSSTVPEPASLLLLGTGLAGIVGVIRRRIVVK